MADATLSVIPVGRDKPPLVDWERSLLAVVRLEGRETLPRVLEVLRRFDFYTEAHPTVYEARSRLLDRREPVDLITLSEEFRRIDHEISDEKAA